MVLLLCVRHGEATHNVAFATQGEAAYVDPAHINSALTPRGRRQAAECTWPCIPEVGVSSPLRRALDTAHRALPLDIPLITLDCLREFPNGVHTPNRLGRNPDSWQASPEETPDQLEKRVESFKAWARSAGYGCIAVFSHTSFLEALLGRKEELPHGCVVQLELQS